MRHARARESFIPVDELPSDLTKAPTWLIEDVKLKGVISSIIVADHGDDGYVVVDGRRRLAAARAAGLQTIPARVFDGEEIGEVVPELAVSLNALRATNWVTSYESVYKLAMSGLDIETIGQRTALTVPTVKSLLAITTAHPTVLKAMHNGAIRYSVVRMLAKCSREMQEKLVNDVLFVKGTITAKDVSAIWPDLKQGEFPEAWMVRAIGAVEELLASAPSGAGFLMAREALGDVIGLLRHYESEEA